MKKIILITISLLIFFSAVAAGLFIYLNQRNEKAIDMNKQTSNEAAHKKDIRQVAWEQLSSGQKEHFGGSWEEGTVSKVTLNDELMMIGVEDKSYKGREVYMVNFDNGLTGVIPLMDMTTLKVVGFAPVD